MLPKTLTQLQNKNANKIEAIDDERDTGDGIWVYLQKGYCFPDRGSHIVHEDTVTNIVSSFKKVLPCTCEECQK